MNDDPSCCSAFDDEPSLFEQDALLDMANKLEELNERLRVVLAQRDDYMRQRAQLAREVKMLTAKVKKLEGARG